MYEIIPISGWNKRTEILVRFSEKLEAIWSNNYRRYKRTKSSREVRKMFLLQNKEFESIREQTSLRKAMYLEKMQTIVMELIPLIILEKPHFILKHLIIKKIREVYEVHGERKHTTYFSIIISEGLNSYIQMQEISTPKKDDEETLEKYEDTVEKLQDFKEYLRYKFSETLINKIIKAKELEDLYEQCKQQIEGGEDNVCNTNQGRQES